jgi:hypothetical protein
MTKTPKQERIMSDRTYLVRDDGSWRRLIVGTAVQVGKTTYHIGPNGRPSLSPYPKQYLPRKRKAA